MTPADGHWPLNLAGLESAAAERLESSAYDYYRSGAGDEITLGRNRAAFDEIQLLPHVLRDVGEIDTQVELLGAPSAMPVLVAPTAFHCLADPEGEGATARGAAAVESIFCLSSLSNTSPEQVGEEPGRKWFQLYVFRDREFTRELVERAAAAGYEALVVTVDAPLLGRRERDVRNNFELPDDLELACVGDRLEAPVGESGLAAYFASQLDATLTWTDLEWLVGISPLPVAVKGVHRPDDAGRALEAGVAAIIVSNHGARQLDTVPATIEMLPAIAAEVGGETTLLVDGGIRRGIDVAKALCLGADAVMVGRPILWGLAIDGAAGVERVLEMLRLELREAMALCGVAELSDLGPELLA